MYSWGKGIDISVWKCEKYVPWCWVRGYAEDSDDNWCKDRYERLSSESKDGKDAFNTRKCTEELFKGHYVTFKGMSYGCDYKIIYFESKVKNIMLSKKTFLIAILDLNW